ncbi:MAG TPA: alpha/beta fold hydrolase [Chitinophagaceae bacterium]|nr:alpha/beta fold hydrolase [Chitinophagaceae bacterium]
MNAKSNIPKEKIYNDAGTFNKSSAAQKGAFYFLQKKIMLRPKALRRDFVFSFNFPFREINIPFGTKYNFNLIQFFPETSERKGIVLYFHGNRDNILRYAKHVPNFTKHKYEVWINDYPEYGKSTGKFTEENVYRQALILYDMALERYSRENIVFYGKSLGSGIATWLASERGCKHLILETPYYSMADLFHVHAPEFLAKRFIHFKFPNYENIQKVTAPITIFHGTHDRIIPYATTVRLQDYLKPGDEFITLQNASHNNVNEYTQYHEKLDSILSD